MKDRPPTPGCYICDPDAFHSDEEPCGLCFDDWLEYVAAVNADA